MLVLVLHKKQKSQMEKPKYKKVQKQIIRTSSWWINHPGSVSPQEGLQSSLIDTVFYLLVRNNKGRGGGVGVKRDGGLLLKGGIIRKRGFNLREGGSVEDLRYCYYWFFVSQM